MSTIDCRVDASGVWFESVDAGTCDVFFDGRRVLSLAASRGTASDGGLLCAWPPILVPYLTGYATVTVRVHSSEEVLFEGMVRFDAVDAAVAVVDKDGTPLAVQKWGTLGSSFTDADDARELIEFTARLLSDLNDKVGVIAHIAYGTLLGAVRAGKVIGHDFDADVTYFVEPGDPATIALESFRVQRELTELGWYVDRGRNGKLVASSGDRTVDVFVSYFQGDTYNLDLWVEGKLRRDQILPLRPITIEGIEVPGPADPEALLELNFGPTWRVPDPAFKYSTSPAHWNRVLGWFGTHTLGFQPWVNYWTSQGSPAADKAAPFVEWVAERARLDQPMLTLGAGSGSDGLAFAERGVEITGYDGFETVLRLGRTAAEHLPEKQRPRLSKVRLPDGRAVLGAGAELALERRPRTVYTRFQPETTPAGGLVNFWLLLRLALANGGDFFFEYRAENKPALDGFTWWLWFHYFEPDEVRRHIEKAGGSIVEETTANAAEAGTQVPVHRVWARFPGGSDATSG